MGSSRVSVLTVSGLKASRVIEGLSKGVSFNIMKALKRGPQDVSTLSKKLKVSQPYISQCVNELERLGLIDVDYEPGKKGIRKICKKRISKIIILIK
jgi:predicted transcriptional regulator